MMAWWAGLEWARPWATLFLALPIVLWLLARRRGRPLSIPVGTFALWKGVPHAESQAHPKRLPPLDTLLMILALAAAALALAGPRQAPDGKSAGVRVVVDRSPSMHLEYGGNLEYEGATRMEAALGLLRRGLDEGDLEVSEWVTPAPGGALLGDSDSRSDGPRLPDAWSARPEPARAEPLWERFDDSRTVWLTDRVPQAEPERAGVVASGGDAVPGLVAGAGPSAIVWDGRELHSQPRADAPRMHLDPGVPAVVADLVRAWALERGVDLSGPDPARPSYLALTVSASPGPPLRAALLAHEGWRAGASVGSFETELPGAETWLTASALDGQGGQPVVRWCPGRVELAVAELDEPAGDPAFFAVSWSRLLDRAIAAAPELVSLAERADAGPSLVRLPRGEPLEAPELPRWPLVALLSALATALAACSLLVRPGD